MRKDFWSLSLLIPQTIGLEVLNIRVDADLVDILTKYDLIVDTIEAAVISHRRDNQISNPVSFPRTM